MPKGMRRAEAVMGKWPDMLRLWRLGYDTYQIAQILELKEYQVYNRISTIKEQQRWLRQPNSMEPTKTEKNAANPATDT